MSVLFTIAGRHPTACTVRILPTRQRVEHLLQIRGQCGRKLHPPAVARMFERKPRGMKKRPLQMCHRADIARNTSMNTSVEGVADNWVADGAEMYADLVRTPGVNGNLTEREPRKVERFRDAGDRFARPSSSR